MDCGAFWQRVAAILQRWRKWIRFVVVILYVVALVIAVPLCIWELEKKGATNHVQAWFVGGMFVLMALPITFWGILQHIINYTTPHLQRHIIRILWMVPIYALNAWFALRFPHAAIYLDTLRECYEAYVIYNFMAYLLSFLNTEYPHLDIQIENKPPVKHVPPLCCLPACHNSPKFIQRCKHGVLQYTVVRPVMTLIAVLCEIFGKYNEGDFDFKTAWSYIVIINNMSQILAMYCLVLFYKAFREELQPLKPVPKFLCVKAVVFMSFWQALLIAALAKLGVIPKDGPWIFYENIQQVSTGIQDFCICIEMFLAAIAHYFSFSHKPFVNLAAEQQNCCSAFFSMWDVRDVTEDVVEHARYIGRGMHKTLSRGARLANGSSSERTPLLAGSTADENVERALSVQNAGYEEPPTPAVILDDDTVSFGGESTTERRYDSFVNRSTTSSMNNYIDFRPDTNSQYEAKESLSRSVSLRGYDSSDDEIGEPKSSLQKRVNSETPVRIAAEVNRDRNRSRKVDDEAFEHLDLPEDDKIQDSMTSHSSDIKPRSHSDKNQEEPELEPNLEESVKAHSEHSQEEGSITDAQAVHSTMDKDVTETSPSDSYTEDNVVTAEEPSDYSHTENPVV